MDHAFVMNQLIKSGVWDDVKKLVYPGAFDPNW